MGHRDLLVTHTLSEAEYHGCRPHPRRSVRRASGFVLTGYSEVELRTTTWDISRLLGDVVGLGSINEPGFTQISFWIACGKLARCRLINTRRLKNRVPPY